MGDYSYILVEQYAAEVLDFSTQYGSDKSISYTAHNLTGKFNKDDNIHRIKNKKAKILLDVFTFVK